MEKFDVVVIGGGPGGYVAAIRCAQLGQKVCLIDEENLGGICLNWGCIPTKSLLKSAELYQTMMKSEKYGISVKEIKFDIKKIVERSIKISEKLVSGINSLMKKNKITVIKNRAIFRNNSEILVGQEIIQFKKAIIATGARARILKGFEPKGNIWTYKEALRPKTLPKSMIIIGSGAIGIEFACFYNSFGVKVTVLEAQDRIMTSEDAEISALARKAFEQQGIKFLTNIELVSQQTTAKNVKVMFKQHGTDKSLEAEIILMAIGIVGNIENLGLENTKIRTEKNHILTNDNMQTDEHNIYAIGDVAGAPWLAHKASHEGIIAAEHLATGKAHSLKKENIPACTYSNPQIASVGLTEEAAKKAGYQLKIGIFPSYANSKSLIIESENGIVKTIFDEKTGELLGAHMIGSEVTELIHSYVITKQMEGTELDLINSIFPHPTLSEMIPESVLNAYKRAIHI
ncbi:MAG: dihydrolipoyl dehydrogenase [Rickettsiaceae bacterium]|nr:dihydrolipoyl dehydrogenase [Rickettsiaceae bacterium]